VHLRYKYKTTSNKLQPRSVQCVFLGYANQYKYRMVTVVMIPKLAKFTLVDMYIFVNFFFHFRVCHLLVRLCHLIPRLFFMTSLLLQVLLSLRCLSCLTCLHYLVPFPCLPSSLLPLRVNSCSYLLPVCLVPAFIPCKLGPNLVLLSPNRFCVLSLPLLSLNPLFLKKSYVSTSVERGYA